MAKKSKVKKPKALTKRDVKAICTQVVFSKYIKELSKNIQKVKASARAERDMIDELRKMQMESSITNLDARLSNVVDRLDDLVHRVLVQDYIIGRLSKPELIAALQQLHPNDALSTAEHLEEIDQQRDAFEEHIKHVTC